MGMQAAPMTVARQYQGTADARRAAGVEAGIEPAARV